VRAKEEASQGPKKSVIGGMMHRVAMGEPHAYSGQHGGKHQGSHDSRQEGEVCGEIPMWSVTLESLGEIFPSPCLGRRHICVCSLRCVLLTTPHVKKCHPPSHVSWGDLL
jgi:hypothetical protein